MYDFAEVKVLIVESTREMHQLFRGVLTMLTVPEENIDSAFSMEEGFRMFCRSNHDIILTDWLDNPNTGIELIRRIRTNPSAPNKYVPIIMTAGSGHMSRVVDSRDAGVSEYLVKPFAANALARRLTRVIENPKKFVVSEAYTGPERRVKDVPFKGEDRRTSKQKEVSQEQLAG